MSGGRPRCRAKFAVLGVPVKDPQRLWARVAPRPSFGPARKSFALLMNRVSFNFLVNLGVDVAPEVTRLHLLRLNLNINLLASHQISCSQLFLILSCLKVTQ